MDKGKADKFDEPQKEVLEELMGSMMRYQWIVTISCFLNKFPMSWHLVSHGMMIPAIQAVYCANTTKNMSELTPGLVNELQEEACSDSCPEIKVSTVLYDRSIIGDYELYCERNIYRMVAQLLVMFGVLLGNFIFGIVADKYGRKWPFIICCLVQPILGAWVAFSPNIYSFLVAKTILNIFVGGTMITSFVLFSEIDGAKYRPIMGILFQVSFSLGHLCLSGFAYWLRDWRFFQLAISLPSILFIYYIWALPESPRWLLSVNKVEEGIKQIEKIARCNNLPTDHIRPKVLAEMERRRETQAREVVKKGELKDLFKSKLMTVITFGMWLNWFGTTCGYYGVAQLATSFTDSFYLNNALAALMQLPGEIFLIYTINAFGRKYSQIFGNCVSALGCLITAFVPNLYKIYSASFAMFGFAYCFPLAYVYSGELFPTIIRNIGVGSSSSIGRVGGMLSPVFAFLAEYSQMIPLIIFAAIMILATVITLFLPETKGRLLPNTVEDVDSWKKKQSKQDNKSV